MSPALTGQFFTTNTTWKSTPHLLPKQLRSSASDKRVLLFMLQACILAKCFLVIYCSVDEANKGNDKVLFFLIYFNVCIFVSWMAAPKIHLSVIMH